MSAAAAIANVVGQVRVLSGGIIVRHCMRILVVGLVVHFNGAPTAHAADPAVSCESGKLKVAGKYASCLLSADSKAVKTSTVPDYSKCMTKFVDTWASSEAKGEGMCPGGEGDQTAIQNFIDYCEVSVANALATGAFPGIGRSTKTGQTTCYDGAGAIIPCAGTGQDGEVQAGLARSFTDNGDGTVTDNVTGLMWEKLADDGSIHDADDAYTWPNAFAVKVAALNSGSFAGYTDWRVPNQFELYSLVNLGAASPATYSAFNTGCAPACTVLTCSCTRSSNHRSSTTYESNPSLAWDVDFLVGDTQALNKTLARQVRAVRAGS